TALSRVADGTAGSRARRVELLRQPRNVPAGFGHVRQRVPHARSRARVARARTPHSRGRGDAMNRRIVLAGGSGFLGEVLAKHFAARGREVVVLTRNPDLRANGVRYVQWDGETLGDWVRELDGAGALINLAGVSVNCRYHARSRKLILDSRVNSTR